MPIEIKNIDSSLVLKNTQDQKLLGVFVFVRTESGKIKFVCLNTPEQVEIQSKICYEFLENHSYQFLVANNAAINKTQGVMSLDTTFTCVAANARDVVINETIIENIGDEVVKLLNQNDSHA